MQSPPQPVSQDVSHSDPKDAFPVEPRNRQPSQEQDDPGTAPWPASPGSPESLKAADSLADQEAQDDAPGSARSTRKRTRRRILLGGGAALGAALAGTAAWALNRYVIDHVEVDDVAAYEAENAVVRSSASAQPASSITITDSTYSSSATRITTEKIVTGSGDDTVTYYIADVRLSDATTLRSAFANNAFGENITAKPSAIAAEHNAVFAINGDYYGFRTDGILIRNGVAYRDTAAREGMALCTDGRLKVYDESTTSAQALLEAGAWNTVSFGPTLVRDGTIQPGIDSVEVDTNVGNRTIQGEHPRTAIGWVDTNHLALVVVDGRDTGYSRGVTMTGLAQIMVDLHCQVAYNLDGGGSSAMYFNGSIINQPSSGGERNTSDIFYIANGS